jgi:hypothetical protein
MPAALAIAIGIWWNANTVSHIFIHRPFFRRRMANAWFAAGLTALLGFPQSAWRDRHLAHHAGRAYRLRLSREVLLQSALIVTLWAVMAAQAPAFFATVYVPGYLGGLLLCAVHGHYEHAAGTTSHYGRVYNALCFNDGYHAEHHRYPSRSWTDLPACRMPSARTSAWPAPLRWLDVVTLETLERIVLRSTLLQRAVLRVHARAFRPLLTTLPPAPHVAIVGGGLFPRTALILRQLVPDAAITIVDASRANLDCARARLRDERVAFVHAHLAFQSSEFRVQLKSESPNLTSELCNLKSPVQSSEVRVQTSESPNPQSEPGNLQSEVCPLQWDVVVIPLSFDGDRDALYSHPPAPAVIVHDWIWRRRGTSRIVSLALLKRVNLIRLESL